MPASYERYGSNGHPEKPSAQDVKSTMTEMATKAGDQVADAAGQVQEAAQEQLDKLADVIRKKPLQAAGVAAGVGFFLALLARR